MDKPVTIIRPECVSCDYIQVQNDLDKNQPAALNTAEKLYQPFTAIRALLSTSKEKYMSLEDTLKSLNYLLYHECLIMLNH